MHVATVVYAGGWADGLRRPANRSDTMGAVEVRSGDDGGYVLTGRRRVVGRVDLIYRWG